jgi:hypothetical protein
LKRTELKGTELKRTQLKGTEIEGNRVEEDWTARGTLERDSQGWPMLAYAA